MHLADLQPSCFATLTPPTFVDKTRDCWICFHSSPTSLIFRSAYTVGEWPGAACVAVHSRGSIVRPESAPKASDSNSCVERAGVTAREVESWRSEQFCCIMRASDRCRCVESSVPRTTPQQCRRVSPRVQSWRENK